MSRRYPTWIVRWNMVAGRDPQDGVMSCGCPWCGALLDAATAADGDDYRPSLGDASVCLYCARVSVFTEDSDLRRPTDTERAELASDEQLFRTISAVKRHGPRDPGRKFEAVDALPPDEQK